MATFLEPDKVLKVNFKSSSLTIKQKIIPDTAKANKDCASWCKKGQPMKPLALLQGTGKPRGIAVHNSEKINAASGTTQAEQYTRATWPNCNMGGVAVHFYTDEVEAWQNLNLNEQGWHARDGSRRHAAHTGATYTMLGGNLDTIAVEIIGPNGEENGARLVAYLLYTTGLRVDDVYTHNYFMSYQYNLNPQDAFFPASAKADKNCPYYILDHWSAFLKKVSTYLQELQGYNQPQQATPPPLPSSATKLYRVQVGSFTVKGNAEGYKDRAIKDGFKDSYITTYQKNGETYYRVQIGAFSVKSNADAYAAKAKAAGYDVIILEESSK